MMHYQCSLLALALLPAAFAYSSDDAGRTTYSVAIDSPATNYAIRIETLWQVGKEQWLVSRVFTRADFGGSAITRITDQVQLDVEGTGPVKHKILGKTWGWGDNTVTLEYVGDEELLNATIKKHGGQQLWLRPEGPDSE